ncbi:hypothetical protein H6P81_014148 [Aristolochia fimbriata]|uniref:Heme-binding protein 2 n=1 Tax=Aristolochia fimbriata TaxID=158543 RepID=A0AAV7EGP4_ARIFI|nr:hypothetical protein H6P81_014148 [Aristolochia fimbriata]
MASEQLKFSLSLLLLTSVFFTPALSRPVLSLHSGDKKVGVFPPTCNRIECPKFNVIHAESEFEIRKYNSTMWSSTSPIEDISFVDATRKGFLQLFDYIQGKNDNKEKIEMTAPVITQVSPSDGPFCASSFVVSFYVPAKNQPNPPPAKGLHTQKWSSKYAAVRQFTGFVADSDVGQEAAALYASLSGSRWAVAVDRATSGDATAVYTLAQYNSPFEFNNRVNEIWMMFDEEDLRP